MNTNVTLRDIAKEAGVSLATVSRALRDDPVTASATHEKVHAAAQRLGYRPDPAMQVLIERRWHGRRANEGLNISYIFNGSSRTETDPVEYKRYRDVAETLGYNLIPEDLEHYPNVRKLIQRMEAKGVSAVVLSYLPTTPYSITEVLNRFATVSVTVSAWRPDCPIIIHDEFQAIESVWKRLEGSGIKRIGVLLRGYSESFTMDLRLGAVYCRQFYVHPLKDRIPVHLYDSDEPDYLEKMQRWVERYKPEVVLGDTHHNLEMLEQIGYKVPQDFGFVAINMWDLQEAGHVAGCFRDNAVLFRRGLQLLNLMFRSGRRGIHQADVVEMVKGTWGNGTTLPGIDFTAEAS